MTSLYLKIWKQYDDTVKSENGTVFALIKQNTNITAIEISQHIINLHNRQLKFKPVETDGFRKQFKKQSDLVFIFFYPSSSSESIGSQTDFGFKDEWSLSWM